MIYFNISIFSHHYPIIKPMIENLFEPVGSRHFSSKPFSRAPTVSWCCIAPQWAVWKRPRRRFHGGIKGVVHGGVGMSSSPQKTDDFDQQNEV